MNNLVAYWYSIAFHCVHLDFFRLLLEILETRALKKGLSPTPNSGLSSEGENVSKAERLQVGRLHSHSDAPGRVLGKEIIVLDGECMLWGC